MSIWGAIAGPVVSELLGGHHRDDAAAAAAQQGAQNYAYQKEFAQHGIRWRVEDAKAAGVHPLYAIGGSGASFAPNPIVVGDRQPGMWESMGQNVSRALIAQETVEQRQTRQAQLGLLAAQTDKEQAMASYYRSEASRNAQAAGASAPFPAATATTGHLALNPQDRLLDTVKQEPNQVISPRSENPSVAAGQNPFWSEFQLRRDGLKIQLPWTQEGPGESMENVPWYLWPAVLGHNMSQYGNRWLWDLISGRNPQAPDRWGEVWDAMPWERARTFAEKFSDRLWHLRQPSGRGPTVSGRIRYGGE